MLELENKLEIPELIKQEIISKANKEILDILEKYNLNMYLLLNISKDRIIAMNYELLKNPQMNNLPIRFNGFEICLETK